MLMNAKQLNPSLLTLPVALVIVGAFDASARAADEPGAPAAAAPGKDDEASQEQKESAEAEGEKKEKKRSLEDRVKAVERKVFLKKKRLEIFPYFGLDLNDAFFQHYLVGASVSYHFADSAAFELRGGYVFASVRSSAIQIVRQDAGAVLNNPPVFRYHADADFDWAPIYGKFSLLGEGILHFDTYITGGGGAFGTDSGAHPSFNVGLGLRTFLSQWLTVRLELRDYFFTDTRADVSGLQKELVFGFSLSGFFPTSFEYEFQ
jgi:outer membrane beta-barrel protein